MYQRILVPVDLADPETNRHAIATAVTLAKADGADVRLLNVLPMTPVMLAEYVPPDFDSQQRVSSEEGLAALARSIEIDRPVTTLVRQGGIYHEILEEAKAFNADLIVMSSPRARMRSYLIGSNAGHVVRYADCSVLVVRRLS